jgi:hypothetical protein
MKAFTLFLSSFVREPKWVTLEVFFIFFLFIILLIVFQGYPLLFGSSIPYAVQQYSPDTSNIVRFVWFFFPVFHFSKALGDIVYFTTASVSGETPTYVWANFSQPLGPYTASESGEVWYAPSTSYSLGCLAALCVVYLAVAWYVGQVFGGEFRKSCIFFLSRVYWGCRRPSDDFVYEGDTLAEVQQASRENKDVRLHKLSKSYKSTTAVKELSLHMKSDAIFTLLGHNGSGKSTTIDCLTGLHNSTHGDAFVFGMSINHQISDIQAIMGVCPQHDVLFPDLSGEWCVCTFKFSHTLLLALDLHTR